MAGPRPLQVVTLIGAHVRLEPLTVAHVEALVVAASIDRSTYEWTNVPDGSAAMTAYVEGLVGEREAATALPFAQVDARTGAVVGCTRLMELRWFSGRDLPDEVEVGGTWLAAPAQRTAINTEAKLLIFTHAFDAIGAWRVALATDANNARSRAAIERAGARFEGVLRNHRVHHGSHLPAGSAVAPRDTAGFGITRDAWPAVRAGLLARLGR